MPLLNWNQRFFESTRGRIVTLLRRARRVMAFVVNSPCFFSK